MPFYLRKSVSVGPFRFNLSKSGLGLSVGVKGFRVGAGPRGNYVHMGMGGIYYRATLPPLRDRAAGARTEPRWRPLSDAQIEPAPVPDGLTEIRSGPVTQMSPASAQDLLNRISEAHARMRLAPVAACLAIALMAAGLVWHLFALAIFAVIGGGLLYAWARRVDESRKAVLLYDLDPDAKQAFQRLCISFDALLAADRIWHINAQGSTGDWKRNAGASSLVRRQVVRPSYGAPGSIASNIRVPSVSVGQKRLFFFPDRILVFEGKSAGAVEYAELRMDARPTRFIEEERVPGDARIVGSTWRFVNKSGEPDKRFNNNRQIPICHYDELHLGSASGLNEKLNVSRPGAAIAFAMAAYEYLEELRAFATGRPSSAAAPVIGMLAERPDADETDAGWRGSMRPIAAALAGLLVLGTIFWPRSPSTTTSAPPSATATPVAPSAPPAVSPPRETEQAMAITPAPPPAEANSTSPPQLPQQAPPQAQPAPRPPVPAPRPQQPPVATAPQPAPEATQPELPLLSSDVAMGARGQAMYTTIRVNMRSEPTVSSQPVAVLEPGLRVVLLGRQGDWSRVQIGGFQGWVNGRYLSAGRSNPRFDSR